MVGKKPEVGSEGRTSRTLPALAVFALAAVVFGVYYGFDGPLYRDYGIYLYGGQRMAEGVPPYAGIFDHKGPLPVALAGLGIVFSSWLGTDDTLTVRAAFFVLACLSAVAVYMLGRAAFRSEGAGLLSALTFVGFQGYSVSAASGPEPKTPLVFLHALSLALMVERRWLSAGICASLAALTWQPAGILLAVGFALTLLRGERWNSTLRFISGAAAPLAATFAYYLYHGAVREFLDGLLVFNLLRVSRSGEPPYANPMRILHPATTGYDFMVYPAMLGLVFILALALSSRLRGLLAPILLSLPLFAAWSALDFQVPEDFYVLLPYASIGLGAMLAFAAHKIGARFGGRFAGISVVAFSILLFGAAIIGGPAFDPDATPGPTLTEQKASVRQISEEFGEDARIVSINAPQVLALLGEENPNPYLFITDGIDRQIDAAYPGGFEAWVGDLEALDPDAIAFFADAQRQMPEADLTEEHEKQLEAWLDSGGYEPEKIGNFWLYVKE